MNTVTSTNTSATTHTVSVSASDVRQVMRFISADIEAVCRAAAHAARAFNLDAALLDVSLLVLNGVAKGVSLEIHKDGVIVREYAFLLSDGPENTSGPPAGQPPLGYVPAGARIRVSVMPDTRVPAAERRAWFDRLGWVDAAPLTYPKDVTTTDFGAYGSGGLGVQRHLMSNPRYDRAAS